MDRFKSNRGKTLYASVDKLLHRVPDTAVLGIRIGPWGTNDYLTSLNELANELGISIESCANRFGTISIAENTNGWLFHPALGFTKYR
jgi:CRISPR-associated endonuclease/helicase Cas3